MEPLLSEIRWPLMEEAFVSNEVNSDSMVSQHPRGAMILAKSFQAAMYTKPEDALAKGIGRWTSVSTQEEFRNDDSDWYSVPVGSCLKAIDDKKKFMDMCVGIAISEDDADDLFDSGKVVHLLCPDENEPGALRTAEG
eukprot:4705943-Prymnesium_polylepis.1